MTVPAPGEMADRLGNPVWHALRTEHDRLSIGNGLARRYPPEYIPFAGLASWSAAAFTALRELLAPGEQIYITGDRPLPPMPGFAVLGELPGLQMVFGRAPHQNAASGNREADSRLELLGEADVPEMLALKEIAFPGYYGPRAPMLGTYYGIRAEGQLVAMAGERLALPGLREVSAVCTHPGYVGRGYAARLIQKLLATHEEAGLGSFLHLAASNQRALALYERLGFVLSRSVFFHSIQRSSDGAGRA